MIIFSSHSWRSLCTRRCSVPATRIPLSIPNLQNRSLDPFFVWELCCLHAFIYLFKCCSSRNSNVSNAYTLVLFNNFTSARQFPSSFPSPNQLLFDTFPFPHQTSRQTHSQTNITSLIISPFFEIPSKMPRLVTILAFLAATALAADFCPTVRLTVLTLTAQLSPRVFLIPPMSARSAVTLLEVRCD